MRFHLEVTKEASAWKPIVGSHLRLRWVRSQAAVNSSTNSLAGTDQPAFPGAITVEARLGDYALIDNSP
jgi:hypothetical protein